MTGAVVLEPGERLKVDSGGWVALDAAGFYVAFDARAQVRGRTSNIKYALELAEGNDDAEEIEPVNKGRKGREMAQTLEEQRAELTKRLEALRLSPDVAGLVQQADQAVRSFKAEAAVLEDQIADLDRETGARARHQRAEAEQRRQAEWQEQRLALLDEEESRLIAIEKAETATRSLVEAINELLATNARMAKLAQQLAVNSKVPSPLSTSDLVARTAGRIASVLGTIKGHRNRFGSLEWPGGASGLYPADRSWRAEEEKKMAAALLQPLLTKGKA